MKLSDIVSAFACEIYTKEIYDPNRLVEFGFCADLMSDALMIMKTVDSPNILDKSILITGLATNQSIRTAEMLDVGVVLFVRGKIPATQVAQLAQESNVILLGTDYTMFNASGYLFTQGVRGITQKK